MTASWSWRSRETSLATGLARGGWPGPGKTAVGDSDTWQIGTGGMGVGEIPDSNKITFDQVADKTAVAAKSVAILTNLYIQNRHFQSVARLRTLDVNGSDHRVHGVEIGLQGLEPLSVPAVRGMSLLVDATQNIHGIPRLEYEDLARLGALLHRDVVMKSIDTIWVSTTALACTSQDERRQSTDVISSVSGTACA